MTGAVPVGSELFRFGGWAYCPLQSKDAEIRVLDSEGCLELSKNAVMACYQMLTKAYHLEGRLKVVHLVLEMVPSLDYNVATTQAVGAFLHCHRLGKGQQREVWTGSSATTCCRYQLNLELAVDRLEGPRLLPALRPLERVFASLYLDLVVHLVANRAEI